MKTWSIIPRLHFIALTPALVLFLQAASASASPTYPPTIQAQLELTAAPDCTLCHRDDAGGTGTVIRPFGRTMIDHFGLTGGSNIVALKAALEGDDAEHLDSDGDGVPDIEELRVGTNPNVGASGVEAASDAPLPETGCAFTARPPAREAPFSTALVGLALALARRRRRARSETMNNALTGLWRERQ